MAAPTTMHVTATAGTCKCTLQTKADGSGRVPQPNKEIFSLDEYRTRYKTYRSDLDLQLLHQTHAWQLIWDDHEVADNTWKAGSADSNDTRAGTYEGVSFTQRKANAVKAYFEWLPIRTVDTTDSLRIWRTFKFGTLADLIMLDTRQYNRDLTDLYYNTDDVEAIKNDSARSLMGGRQEHWLYSEMKNASTRGSQWKVLGQQIVCKCSPVEPYVNGSRASADLRRRGCLGRIHRQPPACAGHHQRQQDRQCHRNLGRLSVGQEPSHWVRR